MRFDGVGILNGQTKRITIDAETRALAIEEMARQGYTDISVIEKASFFSRAKVSNKELCTVFRQLASFAGAGETFTNALGEVADVTSNKGLKEALLDIRRRIELGTPIPIAFSQHKIFPSTVIALLNVADKSGEIETVLEETARYLEQVSDIENGISSSLLYPKIVGVVMAAVFTLMVVFVLPQFRQMYASMKIDMPTITKVLYAFSDFMREDWMIALPGVIAVIYFFKNARRFAPHLCDSLEVKTPIIGSLLHRLYMFRFCKTLQILTHSGVDILEALSLLRGTMTNHIYSDVLEKAIPKVRIGESLSSAMRRNDPEKVYDPLVLAFLATGESTGNMSDLMKTASDHYQKELQVDIANFSKQLEPVMIAVMGVLVGILVISVYMPILGMTQMLQH